MTHENILILTYYWPPAGGPSVQRWLKFTKYLPEFGYRPIVVTVVPQQAEYPLQDESLLQDISPDILVEYTNCSGPYEWYKKFTKTKTAPHSGFVNDSNPNLQQKIARFIRGNFFLPDARRGWNKHAYRKALELVNKYKIQTIITTGPPMSTHLIGLKLKKNIPLKWIADFRDPWTDIYYYNEMYPTCIAKRIDRYYEKQVLINSDSIITVSPYIKKQLASKSFDIISDKIKIIPNGFDETDFDKIVPKEDTFTITYVGTMAISYPIKHFLQSLQNIHKKIPYKIRFVGKIDECIVQRIPDEIKANFEFIPYTPHKKAIEFLQSSSILLLIIPDMPGNKGNLTGKLFEYIGSNTPILCLGPTDGNAAEIIDECYAGQTFSYTDCIGIENYIRYHYQRFINRDDDSHQNVSCKFSRKALTQQLCRIL